MALSTLDTTLVAAVGVVLGSVVSTVPGAWLAARKDRRDELSATARERGQHRLAARLVILELDEAAHVIERSTATGGYLRSGRELDHSTWRQFGPDLASAIDGTDDWQLVTVAYDGIDLLTESLKTAGPDPSTAMLLQAEPRRTWLAIGDAIDVLKRLAGDSPPSLAAWTAQADVLWPPAGGR